MLRRIALTLIPCVALYSVAAFLSSSLSPRAQAKAVRTLAPVVTAVPQLAARSGYIVASS